MNSDIKALVETRFLTRRTAREQLIEERKKEVFQKSPRLKEIETELDSNGYSVMLEIMDGKISPEDGAKFLRERHKKLNEEKKEILSVLGYSEDYLNPPYNCDKCNDTGYVNGELCTCFKNEVIKETYKESNLTKQLQNQTFLNFKLDYYSDEVSDEEGISPREHMRTVLARCVSFVADYDKVNTNLLFYGPSGLGKTYLSSCIANELLEGNKTVLYHTASVIFSALEEMRFGRDQSEEAQILARRIFDVDLLIIDDLGTEFMTQFSVAELFRIINTRLLNGKKMIISTNLSLEDLEKKYSERIVSRIMGSFDLIKFFGEDIRVKKALEGR